MTHSFGNETPHASKLLDEIEMTCPVDVSAARELSTQMVRMAVVVRPADACARRTVVAEGWTTELRQHGVTCQFEEPLSVGSMFHLSYDSDGDAVPARFAMCERCSLIVDGRFEANFRYVQVLGLCGPEEDSSS